LSCTIKRNELGKAVEINPQSEKESQFIKDVSNIPSITEVEEVANIYINKVASDINLEDYEGISYKLGDKEFTDYSEMLFENQGKPYQVVLKTNSQEIVIIEDVLETDSNSSKGRVNQAILKGLIKGKSLIKNGNIHFEPSGTTVLEKVNNTKEAKRVFGKHTVSIREGNTLVFKEEKGLETPESKLVAEAFTTSEPLEKVDLNNVESSFTNFLRNLGISITTLDSYKKSYGIKNSGSKVVTALADVSRGIIALSKGDKVDFHEELAHVAVSHYKDRESLEEALVDVAETSEYVKYSQEYRDAYSDLKGIELETKVRTEVLGKILSEKLKNTSKHPFARIERALNNILNLFRKDVIGNVKSYHSETIEKLVDKMEKGIRSNNMGLFSKTSFDEGTFFKINTNKSSLNLDIDRLIKSFNGAFMKMSKDISKVSFQQAKDIDEEFEVLRGMVSLETSLAALEHISKEVTKKRNSINNKLEESTLLSYVRFARALEITTSNVRLNIEIPLSAPNANQLKQSLETLESRLANEFDKLKKLEEELRKESSVTGRSTTLDYAQKAGRDVKKVEALFDKVTNDVSVFFKWLIPPSYAKNYLLSLMPKLFSDMFNEADVKAQKSLNSYIQKIEDNGWQKYQDELIKKDKDGVATPYMLAPTNKFEQTQKRRDFNILTLSKLSGKTIKEVSDIYDSKNPLEGLDLTPDQVKEFEKAKYKNDRETRENPKDSSYYEEREQELDNLNISDISRNLLSDYSAQRASITRHAFENGKMDKSKLSETDKARLIELAIDKKKKKSAYTIAEYSGRSILKEGLKVSKLSDITTKELDTFPQEIKEFLEKERVENPNREIVFKDPNASVVLEDSIIAAELNLLDYSYQAKNAKNPSANKNLGSDFLQALEEAENRGEGFKWLMDNGGFELSENAIADLKENVSYSDNVEKYIESLQGDRKKDVKENLEILETLVSQKKAILRPFKNANPLEEFHYAQLSDNVKENLIEIEEDIAALKRSIRLPNEFNNSDFKDMNVTLNTEVLEDSVSKGYNDITEYITDNTTRDNKADILNFKKEYERYERDFEAGNPTRMSKKYVEFIDEMSSTDSKTGRLLTPEQFKNRVFKEYAIRKAPSFMKEYRQEGFENFKRDLLTNDIDLIQLATNKQSLLNKYPLLENYEVKSDYNWKEENVIDDVINPRYKPDATFDTYNKVDMDFFNKFFNNPTDAVKKWHDLKTDDISQLTPDKNKEAFGLLVHLTEFNKENLEKFDSAEKTSKYMIPQFSKTRLENTEAVLKSKDKLANLKDSFTDIFKNNTDELLEGQTVNELTDIPDALVIPKYGVTLLPNRKTMSTDLIGNIARFRANAEIYDARVKYKNRAEGIVQAIGQQSFKDRLGGSRAVKKGVESNTYAMSVKKMNEMIYGVKETYSVKPVIFGKERDITSMVNGITSIIQRINLAFSPITDFTSLASGYINIKVQALVEEHFSKKSSLRGEKLLYGMLGSYTKEVGKVNKNSKLNKLGEHFGLFNISERFENTKFSRATKTLHPSKSAFLGSEMANLPVGGNVMATVLVDIKLVDGKFRNFNQYKTYMKLNSKNSISRKELTKKWDNIKGSSIIDFLDTDSEIIQPNTKFKQEFPNNTEQEFMDMTTKASSMISKINSEADGMMSQTDKSEAKRNFLFNMAMTHKSWFYLTLANRFKPRGMDWMLGKETQGSYSNLLDMTSYLIKNSKKLTSMEGFKELRQELGKDEINATSIRRIKVDALILAALLAIGEMIQAGDEPDDSWLENFGQLIYLRSTAEFNSTNAYGIQHNLMEIVETPFVGTSNIDDINPVGIVRDLFKDSEEGKTPLYDRIKRNLPLLKRSYQMINIDKTTKDYIKYNKDLLFNLVPDKDESKK